MIVTGLMKLKHNKEFLEGKTIGVCCNHTAIDEKGTHILTILKEAGISYKRVFGPEHGVDATAQDMISVDDAGYQTVVETVSLYGETEDTLHPDPSTLADLDVLLFDIQDIGSRYYTYQATLGYILEVTAQTDTEVIVLDRPNPINGISISGNIVQKGYESFVSAYPIPTRHGMTMGELGKFFVQELGINSKYSVIKMDNWNRKSFFEFSGLPWIYPSPNMPTIETAIIYVGMCLLEGTNISEGRGTTKPFHLFGAPWINREKLVQILIEVAQKNNLNGVYFRPATFEPRFQKHEGEVCHGAEVLLMNRQKCDPLLLGMVVLEALMIENYEKFQWRTETYEYVDDPIAIDLLFGCSRGREVLEARYRGEEMPTMYELLQEWKPQLTEFEEKRQRCLLYN